MRRALSSLLCASVGLAACGDGSSDPEGLRRTPGGDGPRIIFDALADPTPEVPLPNDLVTFVDPTSPTGRRVNIREFAPTSLESAIRSSADRLDGFGTFAPITVAFDAPVDLATLGPDSVRVIDIDPSSPDAGRVAPLAFDDGSFPIEFTPWAFPPHDPFVDARQLLFDPAFGDAGDPGFSDIYERETNTLMLRPLVPLRQATEYAVVITERLRGENGEPVRSPFSYVNHTIQTPTLERALPLIEQAGVAPRDIAFAWTFTTQTVTRDLEAIAKGLKGEGVFGDLPARFPAELVQMNSMETQLDLLLCGDDAAGDNPCRDNVFILQGEMLDFFTRSLLSAPGSGDLISSFARLLLGVELGEDVNMNLRLDHVDYLVFGRFRSPDFRTDDRDLFDMDYRTGEAFVRESTVPFIAAIPKPRPGFSQPFPVIVHAHGLPSFRWEMLTMANEWAKHGYATVSMDNVAHSPIISVKDVEILVSSIVDEVETGLCDVLPDPLCSDLIRNTLDGLAGPVVDAVRCLLFGSCDGETATFQEALDELLSVGLLRELLVEGRAIDEDGDGNTDHGALFTLDLFESRDRVRQSVVDHMQLMQLLRRLDPAAVPPAVRNPAFASPEELLPNLLAGDFDADGVLDLGGPGNRFYRTGFSMGGILTSILMAVEPDTPAAAPVVPGGGIASDILLRIDLRPVADPVFHELLGPVIVGDPVSEGSDRIATRWIIRKKLERLDFGVDEVLIDNVFPIPIGELRVAPGGSVRVVNQRNGETETTAAAPGLPFVEGIESNEGDPVSIESLDADGNVVDVLTTQAPRTGLGLDRNSPDFRRLASIGQLALEPADPINYAPHWFEDPLPGVPPKQMLMLSVPGDTFVPVNTQVAVARAAGLFGDGNNRCDGLPTTLAECGDAIVDDCDCVNMELARRRVMLGFDEPPERPRFDIDGIGTCTGLGPLPPIATPGGFSAVRYPFASSDVREADGRIVNKGEHWYLAFRDPTIPIDWATYSQNQIASFFDALGAEPPIDCACDFLETGAPCPNLPPE